MFGSQIVSFVEGSSSILQCLKTQKHEKEKQLQPILHHFFALKTSLNAPTSASLLANLTLRSSLSSVISASFFSSSAMRSRRRWR